MRTINLGMLVFKILLKVFVVLNVYLHILYFWNTNYEKYQAFYL